MTIPATPPVNAIDLCPPKHLDAADLKGADCLVTIESAHYTEVGEKHETKGAIKFKEFPRSMVINRTNIKRLIAHLGNDVAAWYGKQITIYPSETDFGGKTVPCIRVREKKA